VKAAVFVVISIALMFAAGCNREPEKAVKVQPPATAAPSAPVRPNEIEFSKDNDTAMKQIEKKKQVNIKLKRSFKGEYSWDIVGTDIKEIIKTNRELKKEFPN
jgi:hypothetical protein